MIVYTSRKLTPSLICSFTTPLTVIPSLKVPQRQESIVLYTFWHPCALYYILIYQVSHNPLLVIAW